MFFETGTSCINLAHLIRILPEDGYTTQSPKRFVLNKEVLEYCSV
jgi:hypothetical protein